jgi:hypothetical protein
MLHETSTQYGLIVLWAETDGAVLVPALVIVAERVTASFRSLVKPTAWEDAPGSLNLQHRRASAGVLDRRFALETGLSPMIDKALASDIVRRSAGFRAALYGHSLSVAAQCPGGD